MHVRVLGNFAEVVKQIAEEESRSVQNTVNKLLIEAIRARGKATTPANDRDAQATA
ncbi:MAG: hypothetical protein K2Y27_00850 [Xanthobacteraceae bacterium]|nr:hypothetical protein [Xanthobacteraceae bacterium]